MVVQKYGKCSVVGAGISGQWAAELLLEKGAEVTICDEKSADELSSAISRFEGRNVKWNLGAEAGQSFAKNQGANQPDLIVLSPGIPSSFPGLREAATRIPVTGEMELAASFAQVPIVAITGSNGKTTTTGLVEHICSENNLPVFVGGNIGQPFSKFIVEGQKASAAVLEISSYQLETVESFHAMGAAILNICPDHLDRYPDMAEYFRAKTNIFNNQTAEDWAIINEDDILLSYKATVGRRFGFSRHTPQHFGSWTQGNEIIVAENGHEIAGRAWNDFKLEGGHNQENVMAAVGLAWKLGLNPQKILDAAISFTAKKHRLELVGEYDDIKYYDDSKGTNVGALAMALASFTPPVVLIAGGQAKGQDFSKLYETMRTKVKQLVLIGEDRDKIGSALAGAVPISVADSMADAVSQAKAAAPKGAVVLLSPACASQDMFSDYRHRGQVFVREVERLNRV